MIVVVIYGIIRSYSDLVSMLDNLKKTPAVVRQSTCNGGVSVSVWILIHSVVDSLVTVVCLTYVSHSRINKKAADSSEAWWPIDYLHI